MTDETVTITIAEYEKLKEDSNFLERLFEAGIDNTECFAYAQELMEND